MEKCGRQKVSVKRFLCSKTQAKIIGWHRLAGKIFAIDVIRNQTSAEIMCVLWETAEKNMAAKLHTVHSCKTLW